MNLISILSADSISSVSVMVNSELLETLTTDENYSHSKVLPVYINDLLKKYQLINLDGLVVSIGPGSYTGLRIGISLAKGFAFSKNIPLIPISTFDIIKYNVDIESSYSILVHSHRHFYFKQSYSGLNRKGKPELVDINTFKDTTIYYTGNEHLDKKYPNYVNHQLDSETMLKIGLKHFDSMIVKDINSVTPMYVSNITLNKND